MSKPQIRGTINIELYEGGGHIMTQIIELKLLPQGLSSIILAMETTPFKDGENVSDKVNNAIKKIRSHEGLELRLPENVSGLTIPGR